MTDERTPYEEATLEISEVTEMFSLEVDNLALGVNGMQQLCHYLARNSGWWAEYDAMPTEYRKHFVGGKLALVHSEVSEALEGFRKNMLDDHLTHRAMFEVELADAIIRIFDLAGSQELDLGRAMIEKLAYNQQRADHKPEARAAEGGKSL